MLIALGASKRGGFVVSENTKASALYLRLAIYVAALFMATSVWFAPNAILGELSTQVGSDASSVRGVTAMVQLGFTIGTMFVALSGLLDRLNSRVLFGGAALINSGLVAAIEMTSSLTVLRVNRFCAGVMLACVYPVAIKICASWFPPKTRGRALALLVGALALGSAAPHGIRTWLESGEIRLFLRMVSSASGLAGVLVFFSGGLGPYGQNNGIEKGQAEEGLNVHSKPGLTSVGAAQRSSAQILRSAASYRQTIWGFCGHMWELFTFWMFVPSLIVVHNAMSVETIDPSFWAFVIIASGFLGCLLGGALSVRLGSKQVAAFALMISLLCCLVNPVLVASGFLSHGVVVGIMILWGMAVLADSPQFSSLASASVRPSEVGTAVALMTSLGYLTSTLSVSLMNRLANDISLPVIFIFVALGPALGTWFLMKDHKT